MSARFEGSGLVSGFFCLFSEKMSGMTPTLTHPAITALHLENDIPAIFPRMSSRMALPTPKIDCNEYAKFVLEIWTNNFWWHVTKVKVTNLNRKDNLLERFERYHRLTTTICKKSGLGEGRKQWRQNISECCCHFSLSLEPYTGLYAGYSRCCYCHWVQLLFNPLPWV